MFEIPKLPYVYDALEPYLGKETMKLHHNKHQQAYCDKLNEALKGRAAASWTIEQILIDLDKIPEASREKIKNNGGGFYHHTLFFESLSPGGGGKPTDALAEVINKTFKDFDSFKDKMIETGKDQFGSGWVWLALKGKELEVYSTSNQDSPLTEGKIPLLLLDVWEHAYYLKYQNRREDYLKALFKVINWKEIGARYDAAME